MAERLVTPQMQVGQVAARYPQALRMLEALGLDYCCGGNRTLTEAAASAGVPVETAVSVLEAVITQEAGAASGARDWLQAPLTELMEHIVRTHHTYLQGELPRLEQMAALVAHVHGPNHGDVLTPLVREYGRLKAELEAHLKKEEEAVFPALSRLEAGREDGAAWGALGELEAEHDAAGRLLATMRQVTGGYALPADACATYAALYDGLQALEADVHRHIHLENNILIPRARAMAPRAA